MQPDLPDPTEPSRLALIRETRVAVELIRMLGTLGSQKLSRDSATTGGPVVVIPGFGGDDGYTRALRRYLRSRGHDAQGWGMGRNLGGLNLPHGIDKLSDRWPTGGRVDDRGETSVPYLCDRFMERIDELHDETGEKVALVGWSLGGYVARETARDRPDKVRKVVTMGSPVIGGPKYTATARYFRKRGMDLDWIEEVVATREENPLSVPVTSIFSKSDGVVAKPTRRTSA